eukprot:4208674-Pleurochrysis_carterae.AAC.1
MFQEQGAVHFRRRCEGKAASSHSRQNTQTLKENAASDKKPQKVSLFLSERRNWKRITLGRLASPRQ